MLALPLLAGVLAGCLSSTPDQAWRAGAPLSGIHSAPGQEGVYVIFRQAPPPVMESQLSARELAQRDAAAFCAQRGQDAAFLNQGGEHRYDPARRHNERTANRQGRARDGTEWVERAFRCQRSSP